MIEKTLQQDDKEDLLEIITAVIKHEFLDSVEICSCILYNTDFFDQIVNLFNSLRFNKANNELLTIFHFLTSNGRPVSHKLRLFQKGIIHTMMRFIDSQNNIVQMRVSEIISSVIIAGQSGLSEGEEHPYHKSLTENGTIQKLIDLYNDSNINKNLHLKIAQLLAILFKAAPLPFAISKDIIDNLKDDNDLQELSRLSECPDP
ncbi:MAG: hypothetical protein EZS28_025525 [Streblomastix strix]|uniref:Uncharacterized protein n=1 Tax=Streblomastix strix TaxID=222440 RepID=A0A5J4V8U7_9EUKA|nr:MAG: hypothetical protein EZS28_025525 [Streblomastix strix]